MCAWRAQLHQCNQKVLLLQDEIGVLIDDTGHPAQSALTFPSTPIALAASGLYILAACQDGIHVYDRTSAAWVQSLPYPAGVVPSPGQTVVTAYNNKGTCVLFAGQQKVPTQSADCTDQK